MSFSLLFVLVSWISVIPCPTRAQDGGRELYFPAYYFYAEKRLVNHWIKTMIVKDLDECEYRCYLDANCVSLNIKNKDPNGTRECELNNSTHLEHDGHLKDNHLYYYRGAENHCGKNQEKCQNNATCLSGFTSKKYRCVCRPGFDGENCAQNIDDCASNLCQNGGNCRDGINGYTCDCEDGYIGKNCETADVCKNYQNLTDATRKYDYVTGVPKCDRELNGWYRFQGAAGTKMVTKCPPIGRCGADSPAWLDGDHPTMAQGTVSRTACIHRFRKCCETGHFIEVKNCGSYYIYHLTYTGVCNTRYCSTD